MLVVVKNQRNFKKNYISHEAPEGFKERGRSFPAGGGGGGVKRGGAVSVRDKIQPSARRRGF